nr:MAG TPA: hypothetical protein [Caudoviricetes sp.]
MYSPISASECFMLILHIREFSIFSLPADW